MYTKIQLFTIFYSHTYGRSKIRIRKYINLKNIFIDINYRFFFLKSHIGYKNWSIHITHAYIDVKVNTGHLDINGDAIRI